MKIALLILGITMLSAQGAETQKRTKSLKFDGRSVEAARPGRFDSFTHLSEGDQAGKRKKLYELPQDFSGRIADESMEMGYRK